MQFRELYYRDVQLNILIQKIIYVSQYFLLIEFAYLLLRKALCFKLTCAGYFLYIYNDQYFTLLISRTHFNLKKVPCSPRNTIFGVNGESPGMVLELSMGPQIIQVTRPDKNRADRISASSWSPEARPAGAVWIRKDTASLRRSGKRKWIRLIKAEHRVVVLDKNQRSWHEFRCNEITD